MKILTAAAVALAMAGGLAIAQETGSTSDTEGDATTYLKGPQVNDLYTDESRTTVKPSAEFKEAWDKFNDADRANIKQACEANRDVSYNPLCTNVKEMM